MLDAILTTKREEVRKRKDLYPIKLLAQSPYYESPCVPLTRYLEREDLTGIIAEIKRASPSAGDIHPYLSVEKLSIGYMQHGASALSVLTDGPCFKGSLEDLKTARKFNFCPILRKDFIIDEYQLHEARAYGADVVLLIAKALTPQRTKELSQAAHQLGLEVLLELHEASESEHLNDAVNLVGINARNLQTLAVDHKAMVAILKAIPKDIPVIAESGINTPETLLALKKEGFKGFLIGEHFMRSANPARALGNFVRTVKELSDAR